MNGNKLRKGGQNQTAQLADSKDRAIRLAGPVASISVSLMAISGF